MAKVKDPITGQWVEAVGIQGQEGKRGPMGPMGPQGPQGDRGPIGLRGYKGEDGYTPIRGVDYFTEEDIEWFVQMIMNRLPSIPEEPKEDENFEDNF